MWKKKGTPVPKGRSGDGPGRRPGGQPVPGGVQRVSLPRRQALSRPVALGLALLLVVISCGVSGFLAWQGGPIALGSLGLLIDNAARPALSPTPETSPSPSVPEAKPVVVDECQLLSPVDLNRYHHGYNVLSASAWPAGDEDDNNRWAASCEYGYATWPPGQGVLVLQVESDADFDEQVKDMRARVDKNGGTIFSTNTKADESWYVLFNKAPTGSKKSKTADGQCVLAKVGETALSICNWMYSSERPDRKALFTILDHALPQVPERSIIEQSRIDRLCNKIDVVAAAAAVQSALPGEREIKTATGETSCTFSGAYGTYAEVYVRNIKASKEDLADFKKQKGATRIPRLGKDGYFLVDEDYDNERIIYLVLRTVLLEVRLSCPCADGDDEALEDGKPLTDDERAFLRTLVKSFDGVPG